MPLHTGAAAPSVSGTSTNSTVTCYWVFSTNNSVCPSSSITFNACLWNGTTNANIVCQNSLRPTTTAATFYNLTPYSWYTCSITAIINSSVYGQATSNAGIFSVMTAESVPHAPTFVQVGAVTSTTATLMWQAPSPQTGIIQSYIIYFTLKDNQPNGYKCPVTNIAYAPGWSTITTLTGLCACRNYSITIAANTSAGYGPASAPVSALTLAGSPSQLSVLVNGTSAATATSISVRWTPDNSTCLTQYSVSISPPDSPNSTVTTLNTTYTFYGLRAYTNYAVTIVPSTVPGPFGVRTGNAYYQSFMTQQSGTPLLRNDNTCKRVMQLWLWQRLVKRVLLHTIWFSLETFYRRCLRRCSGVRV